MVHPVHPQLNPRWKDRFRNDYKILARFEAFLALPEMNKYEEQGFVRRASGFTDGFIACEKDLY